jgi:hypothetical protein
MDAPAASPTVQIDPVQAVASAFSHAAVQVTNCVRCGGAVKTTVLSRVRKAGAFNGTVMDGLASCSFLVATTHVSGSFSARFSSGLTSRFCQVSSPRPCLIFCVETCSLFLSFFPSDRFPFASTRASVCYSPPFLKSSCSCCLLPPRRWWWCPRTVAPHPIPHSWLGPGGGSASRQP